MHNNKENFRYSSIHTPFICTLNRIYSVILTLLQQLIYIYQLIHSNKDRIYYCSTSSVCNFLIVGAPVVVDVVDVVIFSLGKILSMGILVNSLLVTSLKT